MTPSEFEEYLSHLTNEQYKAFIQERISRLNPEQQIITQAREVKKKERLTLINSLMNSKDENAQERLYNALRDDTDNCEHGRSYCKHCVLCGEIDYIMFPELFDENGIRLDEPEED